MEYPHNRLLVFAKAPVEKQVKSRLIPDLGVQQATQLYRLMVQQTVSLAVNSDLCPVSVWCSPNSQHDFFQQLSKQYGLELHEQQGNDLGERMYHAASHALQSAKSVVIIGCDCLQFTGTHLRSAMASLASANNDVVITPAHDGGYVLIGLNRVDRRLFEKINWGSDEVLQQTHQALRELNWSWQEQEVLRDLDTHADLQDIISHRQNYQLSPELDDIVNVLVNNR